MLPVGLYALGEGLHISEKKSGGGVGGEGGEGGGGRGGEGGGGEAKGEGGRGGPWSLNTLRRGLRRGVRFRVSNILLADRRRGGGVPQAGYCTGTGGAAHAQHNSLGLHSKSKRWCLSLSGAVLGPGTLEEGGYGLSRPEWEFRV